MDDAFIQQTKKNINSLIAAGKYREAYNLCSGVLSRYPQEKEFEKLMGIIEKESEKANEEIIERKITELSPLWDQEKYEEILVELKNLLTYAPNNKKLKNLLAKAQTLYKEQIENLKKHFRKTQEEKLDRLLAEDPDRLVSELYSLERGNPGNQDVMAITKTFRDKLIHKKIQEKKELLSSDKFDIIENFLTNLKKIDDKNTEIAELEKATKQRKANNTVEAQKEFIYKGENYLETLIELKKYPEAIKVAGEILSIDPNDKEAKKILTKAKNSYFRQTKDRSAEMIRRDFPKLKNEYQSNKSKFVKI